MARACGRLSSRPAPVGPPLAVVLVLVSPAFAWPKWLEPKWLRGGRAPPHALRHPWVWGVAAGPTLVSPPTRVFSRFSRCGASFGPLPCHGVGAGPLGSRYGVSAKTACVCVRRVFTNKQKLTPFFLRHFGSSIFLSILAFYVTYFSPPAHNLRGG